MNLSRRPSLPVDVPNNKESDVCTICSLCNKILLGVRRNSPPTHTSSLRLSNDVHPSKFTINEIKGDPSHGLCLSCFDHMDAALVNNNSKNNRRRSDSHSPTGSPPSLSPLRISPIHISPSATTSEPLKVLVVDDNKLQRLIHKRIVEHAGYVCDVATNGTQACEMIKQNEYAMVLMDLMMGDTDGWTSALNMRLLRKHVADDRMTIIGVTGLHVDSKLVDKCTAAGMDSVIQKPVSQQLFNKLLSNM